MNPIPSITLPIASIVSCLLLSIATPSVAQPPVCPRPAADVTWAQSYESAVELAKQDKKVLFIAVNMDGESANDRLAKDVYTAPEIANLASSTVNVIASLSSHAGSGGNCARFKGITCAAHQACEKSVRGSVLKADDVGNIVAPQHVFLDAAGKPLLSVPYEVTSEELEWCFVTALRKADPSSKIAMPSKARAPTRLVMGAVYDPKEGVGGAIQPVTKAEVVGLIKQVKRGGMSDDDRRTAFWRILHSDLPEALDFIQAELRSGGAAPGDQGSGGGGSGAGQASGDGGGYKHQQILHAMGAVSPPVYWEMAAAFLSVDDDDLRIAAAVALEQMAAPLAIKEIEKQLAKEKKPEVKKELVRAFAACGREESKVKAAIIKRVRTEKDALVRVNSIVALGLLEQDAEVQAALRGIAAAKDDSSRCAAALAMAITRDEGYLTVLEPLSKEDVSPELKDAITRSVEVLRGGPIRRLQMLLQTVCKDTIPRERTFGIWGE